SCGTVPTVREKVYSPRLLLALQPLTNPRRTTTGQVPCDCPRARYNPLHVPVAPLPTSREPAPMRRQLCCRMTCVLVVLTVPALLLSGPTAPPKVTPAHARDGADAPRAHDPRLQVTLF